MFFLPQTDISHGKMSFLSHLAVYVFSLEGIKNREQIPCETPCEARLLNAKPELRWALRVARRSATR